MWNTNHRPERVEPAFNESLKRLRIDYLDLYLIHTPFAFQPGDDQDPRDENDKVIYDNGVTLLDTWRAMERLVDGGNCRASENFDISPLPEDAFEEINHIQTRQRFNQVVHTGVPGFIARADSDVK